MTFIKSTRKLFGTALIAALLSIFSINQANAAPTQTEASANDLVFMVEFNIKPEYKEDFLNSLTVLAEEMAKEETFVVTYLHQDVNDPNKFIIYERWSEPSMEAFMKNQLQAKRYRDDYETHLPNWSSQPRKITVLKHQLAL